MSSYQKRRISEQTYKFPKCIFSIFSSSQYTIYIYFVYDVVQLELRCCWSMKFFLPPFRTLCAVRRTAKGVGVGSTTKERKRNGADWEKLRKINTWVIRKHKYWMFRVCEWEKGKRSARLCQSWRIYGKLLMYSIHGKSESKMKEFSIFFCSSLRKKLNWNFSIIYIWGNESFWLFILVVFIQHWMNKKKFR